MEVHKSGMAWTGRVMELSDIKDADRILRAEVVCGKGGRWSGVVRKGDVEEGDVVVVFLPDSIVPNDPIFSFMEARKFRVTMMRLRGCPSEVLIMPTAPFSVPTALVDVGTDVTDLLGIMKYEKEIPLSLSGLMAGAFPSFIPKTDEPNFQTVPEMREALIGHECVITTKHDGSSQTFYHRDGHIGGCSRNWELRDTPEAAVWDIARRYQLTEYLEQFGNVAIQWEAVGPKIQRNPLKLARVEPRVFNVWDVDRQEYFHYKEARELAKVFSLPFVDAFCTTYQPFGDDELRTLAEGSYAETGKQREGIVIRPVREMRVDGQRLSFKVINLSYKGQ